MDVSVEIHCAACGSANYSLPEGAADDGAVACNDCGRRLGSVARHREHREIEWPKLITALLIEGAIFRLVKGLVDHQVRVAFARTTGTWPGTEGPEVE